MILRLLEPRLVLFALLESIQPKVPLAVHVPMVTSSNMIHAPHVTNAKPGRLRRRQGSPNVKIAMLDPTNPRKERLLVSLVPPERFRRQLGPPNVTNVWSELNRRQIDSRVMHATPDNILRPVPALLVQREHINRRLGNRRVFHVQSESLRLPLVPQNVPAVARGQVHPTTANHARIVSLASIRHRVSAKIVLQGRFRQSAADRRANRVRQASIRRRKGKVRVFPALVAISQLIRGVSARHALRERFQLLGSVNLVMLEVLNLRRDRRRVCPVQLAITSHRLARRRVCPALRDMVRRQPDRAAARCVRLESIRQMANVLIVLPVSIKDLKANPPALHVAQPLTRHQHRLQRVQRALLDMRQPYLDKRPVLIVTAGSTPSREHVRAVQLEPISRLVDSPPARIVSQESFKHLLVQQHVQLALAESRMAATQNVPVVQRESSLRAGLVKTASLASFKEMVDRLLVNHVRQLSTKMLSAQVPASSVPAVLNQTQITQGV
jgi:hypothetical protein